MNKVKAFAAKDAKSSLVPFEIYRRDLRPHDVQIQILFCGVCHTDLHMVKNEWQNTQYPLVPGHEIVGEVIAKGIEVKGFAVGELVAVGCLVDSCRSCKSCLENAEQYCDNGNTLTYNGNDKIDRSVTYGGYSKQIVVDEKFVLHVPKKFGRNDLAGVAPLLCAGITTYSPLRHWNVGPGKRVGVVGVGGLGHIAIKIAHALGAHVTVFTTSTGKIQDALKLGADEVVVSTNPAEMQKQTGCLDFILNTVAVAHNLDAFLELLKRDGTMCCVGLPASPHPSPSMGHLIFRRRSLAGSLIGGIKETQEMLDFCAEHSILADVELIRMEDINKAYERMLKSDVKYRFVIDIGLL